MKLFIQTLIKNNMWLFVILFNFLINMDYCVRHLLPQHMTEADFIDKIISPNYITGTEVFVIAVLLFVIIYFLRLIILPFIYDTILSSNENNLVVKAVNLLKNNYFFRIIILSIIIAFNIKYMYERAIIGADLLLPYIVLFIYWDWKKLASNLKNKGVSFPKIIKCDLLKGYIKKYLKCITSYFDKFSMKNSGLLFVLCNIFCQGAISCFLLFKIDDAIIYFLTKKFLLDVQHCVDVFYVWLLLVFVVVYPIVRTILLPLLYRQILKRKDSSFIYNLIFNLRNKILYKILFLFLFIIIDFMIFLNLTEIINMGMVIRYYSLFGIAPLYLLLYFYWYYIDKYSISEF